MIPWRFVGVTAMQAQQRMQFVHKHDPSCTTKVFSTEALLWASVWGCVVGGAARTAKWHPHTADMFP